MPATECGPRKSHVIHADYATAYAVAREEMARGVKRKQCSRTLCRCGEELLLCWGPKVDLYLRHLPGSGCPGESHEHRLAKSLLCRFLNGGGVLEVNALRECCLDLVSESYALEAGQRCVEERRVDSGTAVFDCAIERDSKIEVGFEILHTHRTENVVARNRVPWYEFRADDVIEELEEPAQRGARRTLTGRARDHPRPAQEPAQPVAAAEGAKRQRVVSPYDPHRVLHGAPCGNPRFGGLGRMFEGRFVLTNPRAVAVFKRRLQCANCREGYSGFAAAKPFCLNCFSRIQNASLALTMQRFCENFLVNEAGFVSLEAVRARWQASAPAWSSLARKSFWSIELDACNFCAWKKPSCRVNLKSQSVVYRCNDSCPINGKTASKSGQPSAGQLAAAGTPERDREASRV